MNVIIISREIIKPNTPTPNHKKIVYLSLIDQIVPPIYNSILLFYQNDPNNDHPFNTIENRSTLLKQSLSEILVDFYPLAGRVRRNELIDCNDEGVEFCEANVVSDKHLAQFIENPSVAELKGITQPRPSNNVVLSVQVNHFGCGGMALGLRLLHKIRDGAASAEFINAWSTKTRDPNHIMSPPNFNGAALFPPLRQLNDANPQRPALNKEEERVGVRRVIFDKKVIDGLKAEAATFLDQEKSLVIRRPPTTNEVVTAFISKNLPKTYSYLHFVNLRPRMSPPIPADSFGNFTWFAKTPPPPSSLCSETEHNNESWSAFIIESLRESIKKINNDFIQELVSDKNDSRSSSSRMKAAEKGIDELYKQSDNCVFLTNHSKFGVYEANFGMGKPIWACLRSIFSKNSGLVMSTPCGEGVEVWICMLEHEFGMLDHSASSNLGDHPIVKHVPSD
ncbi:hypothetical protein vseg_010447 [Gypsophila vaccaria]